MGVIFIRMILHYRIPSGYNCVLTQPESRTVTAFEGSRRIASGPLAKVAARAAEVVARGETAPVLIFDDRTSEVIDIDLRRMPGEPGYQSPQPIVGDSAETRGRGRPKLGVVAREVTLLPRHWEWLNEQKGGASAVLRKLVEQARRNSIPADAIRAAREGLYRFVTTMAGNEPGYEEAIRALFRGDATGFAAQISHWPHDVRDHARRLAPAAFSPLGQAVPPAVVS
jgi:hypothetical protein